MGWVRGVCKGKDVWLEANASGEPVVQSGRVPVRYSDKEGAKIYRAGLGNVSVSDPTVLELPAGASADAAPKGRGRGGRGSGFGKAGTRSAAQASAAKVAAAELVAGFGGDVAICFTDGGCKGNPGPAGSGAVVRLPDGRLFEGYRALGRATNNVGELTAVELAMSLLDEAGWPLDAPVELLTDSDYTHGVLTRGWKAKANRELIARVKAALARRKVRLHWVAGHVGIPENERADELAGMGVQESMGR